MEKLETTINTRVSKETRAKLQKQADKRRLKLSTVAREALREKADRKE
jgi:hypothetical protein